MSLDSMKDILVTQLNQFLNKLSETIKSENKKTLDELSNKLVDIKNAQDFQENAKLIETLSKLTQSLTDDDKLKQLLQIYSKSLAGPNKMPINHQLSEIVHKLQVTTQVQNDRMDELMYEIRDFMTFMSAHNLDAIPVDRKHLMDNSEKMLANLKELRKEMKQFNKTKHHVILNKAKRCKATGKILSVDGKSCVALIDKKGRQRSIPKTKLDSLDYSLASLETVEFPNEYKELLEDISEKLNVLLYKYQDRLGFRKEHERLWINPSQKLSSDKLIRFDTIGNRMFIERSF